MYNVLEKIMKNFPNYGIIFLGLETVGCGSSKPSFKQLSKINTSLAAATP
jgi:hypothetical protein